MSLIAEILYIGILFGEDFFITFIFYYLADFEKFRY